MDFAHQQRNPSKHLMNIGMVIALHIVIVWALVNGLGKHVIDVEVARPPLVVGNIDEFKNKPPPEPQPHDRLRPPPMPNVFADDFKIDVVPVRPTITPATPDNPKQEVREVAPQITPAVIDPAHACQQPEYPSLSLNRDEEGAVTLLMLVGVDGRVRESQVQQSSGHTRLDTAARDALTQCHFKPRVVNGKPEPSWHQLRFVWRIQ